MAKSFLQQGLPPWRPNQIPRGETADKDGSGAEEDGRGGGAELEAGGEPQPLPRPKSVTGLLPRPKQTPPQGGTKKEEEEQDKEGSERGGGGQTTIKARSVAEELPAVGHGIGNGNGNGGREGKPTRLGPAERALSFMGRLPRRKQVLHGKTRSSGLCYSGLECASSR